MRDRGQSELSLRDIIQSDPETLGGTPVFTGTRVPVETLVSYLEGGSTLDEFMENFPSVTRQQAVAFLEQAARALLDHVA